MPRSERGWLITPDELRRWILLETEELLVVNKPALIVCHPSKEGPWSSLVGACREYLRLDRLHMPSRLDRETSGVVVFAKDHKAASRLQRAATRRSVRKTYFAILSGCLDRPQVIREPLGRDAAADYTSRQCVTPEGRPAETEFVPLVQGGGYTLCRVHPRTGRLHQIRVHASWMGHAVAGDKLYGPDPDLMLEFVRHGFTPRLESMLPLPRHALHAAEIAFRTCRGEEVFSAPLAEDLAAFCRERMGVLNLPGSRTPCPPPTCA